MAIRKLVVIPDTGFMREIGGVTGPLQRPTRIPVDNIAELIKNGKTVWECDPADPMDAKKRIRLTAANLRKANFVGTVAAPVAAPVEEPVAAPVEETPVEAPVEEVVQEEAAPVDEAPVDEAPVEETETQGNNNNHKKNKKK